MPKLLEAKLRKIARKRWPNNKQRQDEYIFGTLRKTGWKPKGEQ